MSFLSGLFGKKPDKRELFKNITRGVNPLDIWEIKGDLGEGTFGVVHKVCISIRLTRLCLCPFSVVTPMSSSF